MYGDQVYPEKKPYGLLALLFLALLALAAVAYWKMAKPAPGPYGAIAMSDSSLTYGGAWGYPDPLSAYKRSLDECSKAGSTDCVVKVILKNNCGALAISPQLNKSFLVTGTDQVQTTQVAKAQCQDAGATDCEIHENICSTGS